MAFLLMEDAVPDEKPGGTVLEVNTDEIYPNPAQPRRVFDEESLASLSDSIRRHGILQPPVVRKRSGGGYELIAGERRFRAAVLCGMKKIPCLLHNGGEEESAELAIIENLQRRDLSLFEEAAAIAALCERCGLTQAEVGERLAVSQSYVANKLRILRLSEEARAIVERAGLTERHVRAVLRLPEEGRIPALQKMAAQEMNVATAERYVERLLSEKKPAPHRAGVIKDIRLFYNSLDRAVKLVREAGIGIASERREDDEAIEVVIRIRKNRPGA